MKSGRSETFFATENAYVVQHDLCLEFANRGSKIWERVLAFGVEWSGVSAFAPLS